MKVIKKLIWLGILIVLASILSILDRYISSIIMPLIPVIGSFIANIKIGLANLIILYIIEHFDLKYNLLGIILKSTIIGFIYGSMITFLIGLLGTILSFISMYIINKLLTGTHKYIFISIVGGFTHMLGQMIMVFIFYKVEFSINSLLLYSPFVLTIGIISGLCIGLIYDNIRKVLNNIIKQ